MARAAAPMGDLRSDLTALLDQAAAHGRKTVTIASVRRALGPPPQPPTAHEIAIARDGWLISHPATCKTADCSVAAAARRTLASTKRQPGRYQATLTRNGLALRRLSTSDSA